jgi:hypothetical protein
MTRANGDDSLSGEAALRATELEIEQTRERLAQSIGALREELTTLVDWREWIRARPTVFLGGAFALGLLLGWRAAGR